MFDVFKEKINKLMERRKFNPLLTRKIQKGSLAWEYLESRGLPTSVEAYDFTGDFEYQGKVYHLPGCVVVPLREIDGELKGVWIRFIHEKRFYIWVTNPNNQKFWVDIQDPDENEVIVVAESIFDAIALREIFGFKNVAAALGAKLSAEMVQRLNSLGHPKVLAFDMDSAGMKGMLSHLDSAGSSHWGILKTSLTKESVDFYGIKDYNDVLRKVKEFGLDIKWSILYSIQAKVFLKSRL